jgi:4-amino-4-deoxy-L-arabinose transferase-like glycosyltransferase
VTSENSQRSNLYLSVVVIALSIVTTTVFWAALPAQYATDDGTDFKQNYKPVAENIANGNGIVLDGQPATKLPPAYPILLAAVFKICGWLGVRPETGAAAVNLMGMAAVAVLLFWLGRLMFGQLAGLLGATFWMTYPFALWLTKQPNSEIPFMVFLYGGLLLLYYLLFRRTRWRLGYLLCGVVFGLAMLTRPIAIGIGLPLAIFVWFASRKLNYRLRAVTLTVFLLGSVITVLPWEAWVYSKTGKVIPLSTSGVTNIREGLVFAVNDTPHRVEGGVPQDVEAVMSDMWQRREEMRSLGGIAAVSWSEFQDHPIAMTKLLFLKVARSWYGTDTRRNEKIILAVQLVYLGLVAWALRIAWTRGKEWRMPTVLIMSLVAYFWVMTVLVNSTFRYMLPATGAMFLLVGAALASIRTSKERDLAFANEQTQTTSVA